MKTIGIDLTFIENMEAGELSSTLGGNPLSCAGALAVLEIMEDEK